MAGKADPEVVNALADFETRFGDSVPTGTYLDMAVNMPMVDPKKLNCPVCVIRPEHDGNESEKEINRFFAELATREKQFTMMRGLPHAGGISAASGIGCGMSSTLFSTIHWRKLKQPA